MSDFRFLSTHRTWEDWCGMLLGVLIAFTIGILVFGLAQLEYIALQRWEEVAEIVLGLWLIASPYIFGYSGDGLLRLWHSSLGGVVVLLGALQLWQDWDRNDQDMLEHGQ